MKFLHSWPRKIYTSTSLHGLPEPLSKPHRGRFPKQITTSIPCRKTWLHGTGVAMYSVGQERRLVDPPSQVVAGVRTVTTNMDGRDALPRMSRPFAFLRTNSFRTNTENWNRYFVLEFTRLLFNVRTRRRIHFSNASAPNLA